MVWVPEGKRQKVEIVINPKPADDDWLIKVLRALAGKGDPRAAV